MDWDKKRNQSSAHRIDEIIKRVNGLHHTGDNTQEKDHFVEIKEVINLLNKYVTDYKI